MNCWEFRKCGCGPGGGNAKAIGGCPTASQVIFNGCNGGVNAGRACWMISDTRCHPGVTQGSFIEKIVQCRSCEFYQHLERQGGFFIPNDKGVPVDSKKPYEERIVSSKMDDLQSILYLFEQLSRHRDGRSIKMTTPYKEIPIATSGEILKLHGSKAIFRANELQLSAINACKETVISSDLLPVHLLGRLVDMDIQESTVTLNNFSYAEVYTSFRKTVRVRLPKPLNVVMQAGQSTISGMIQDISYGGCGMHTLTTAGLDHAEGVSLKLKLFEPGTFQVMEAEVPSQVVRVINEHPPFKVALRFQHNPHSEKVVSHFIHQRELEIVKELRAAL